MLVITITLKNVTWLKENNYEQYSKLYGWWLLVAWRSGLLYEKWVPSFGKNDPDVLFIEGPTRLFNPTFPQSVIDRRMREDPEAAGAEYMAQWRDDLSGFLDRELVEIIVRT